MPCSGRNTAPPAQAHPTHRAESNHRIGEPLCPTASAGCKESGTTEDPKPLVTLEADAVHLLFELERVSAAVTAEGAEGGRRNATPTLLSSAAQHSANLQP